MVLESLIPEKDGIDLTRDVIAMEIPTKVLVLTMDTGTHNAFRMLRAGGHHQYISASGDLDPGLDDPDPTSCQASTDDPIMRVHFEAIASGYTQVEIGIGDDFGSVVVGSDGLHVPTQNATVRLAVPEPGFAAELWTTLAGLITATARRRYPSPSTSPGGACSPHRP